MNNLPRAVLAQYSAEYQPQRIEPLGTAGGFSGARFWRFASAAGVMCLRRWPSEHPSVERLQQIHHVLRHVAQEGLRVIPVPIPTQAGPTFVEYGGHLYELAPWLPGSADFKEHPSEPRLQAALAATAQFHRAASDVPGLPQVTGVSPGLAARRRQISELREGGLLKVEAAISPKVFPGLEPLARGIMSLVPTRLPPIEAALREMELVPLLLQPSIRDLRGEHFLFEDKHLSGIVDFGSMRVESPVGDVARALGSLVGDDASRRNMGLEAYEAIRPLSENERRALPVFDHSEVLLSAVNWLDWIYCQHRQFDDAAAVLARVQALIVRLRCLPKAGSFT